MACSVMKPYSVSTPIGPLKIVCCDNGLHSLEFPRSYNEPLHEDRSITIQLLEGEESSPRLLLDIVGWLDLYFQAPNKICEVEMPPICNAQKGLFEKAIWTTMAKEVPFGNTISYGQLATLAKHPGAARAVGTVMRNNQVPIFLPCHRVVKGDGAIGNYSGGKFLKEWLLRHEKSSGTTCK